MLPRKGDFICYVPPHWQVFQPDLPVFLGCAILTVLTTMWCFTIMIIITIITGGYGKYKSLSKRRLHLGRFWSSSTSWVLCKPLCLQVKLQSKALFIYIVIKEIVMAVIVVKIANPKCIRKKHSSEDTKYCFRYAWIATNILTWRHSSYRVFFYWSALKNDCVSDYM